MEWWQPLLCAGPQTWQRVWQLSSAGRQPSSRHAGQPSACVSRRLASRSWPAGRQAPAHELTGRSALTSSRSTSLQ